MRKSESIHCVMSSILQITHTATIKYFQANLSSSHRCTAWRCCSVWRACSRSEIIASCACTCAWRGQANKKDEKKTTFSNAVGGIEMDTGMYNCLQDIPRDHQETQYVHRQSWRASQGHACASGSTLRWATCNDNSNQVSNCTWPWRKTAFLKVNGTFKLVTHL